jgi:hydrogenase expression/formation protein HypC
MCLAIPVRIVALTGPGTAKVALGGIVKEISVILIEDPQPGEYVVLHVGFALAKIDEAEARRTLELLAELDPAVMAEFAAADTRVAAPS